jgi:outer membrane protein assembly factor BamB
MVKFSLLLIATLVAVPCLAEPPVKGKTGDWPMWGGSPDRNMVSADTGLPAEWDAKAGKNVKWVAPLGDTTYGAPVIAGGKVLIGTNNGGNLRPGITGDKGVLVCLDEKTGKFLWQATHDKLPSGSINDWPDQGIVSAPLVEGDRLYYVSNQCQVVCADVDGFADGENDGPYRDEKHKQKQDADIVWILDMYRDLKVFPHNLATCSPVGLGNLLFISTSNGVDDTHLKMPHPDAPDLIAVDKVTGKVVWQRSDPGANVFHGQWSSPALGMVRGKPQVIFGAGDGWCYAYEPKTGELIWKFDLNPKGTEWAPHGRGTKNSIVGTPVVHNDKVYLAVGQDPDHGTGPGHLYAIDATGKGDVTETARVWRVGGEGFGRSLSTVAIADGLLYAADLNGFLYCFDVTTGKQHWRHDTFAAVWGSPFVVDGKVLLGTTDGEVIVLAHGKELKELAVNDQQSTVYSTPVVANGVLYVANRRALYAIARGEKSEAKSEK